MKSLGINIASNIVTKIWNMMSVYLLIPAYIKILGETSYGLVSFFATLQTVINVLGLGLSNTLRREFASGENTEINSIRKYKLMRSVENIYFLIAIFVMIICKFGSRSISEKWLNIETLDSSMVANVISLMGVSIALQLIANLYVGCLFGLDYQVFANILCIGWSVTKSIGSLVIIAFISPSLILFYGWHITMDIVYLILLRINSQRKLSLKCTPKWSLKDFSNIVMIWKYTCGILFISFIVLINKQLDKVVISKYLSLSELGAYNIATTLGSLSIIVPTALYTTVFSRFTNYATTGEKEKLEKEFMKINKIAGLVLSSMGSFIAVYALPLIRVWTGTDSYISILGVVATIVVLAVAVTEYQEMPYALALANGNTKYNVIVGSVFIPIIFITTFYGITKYGLIGAGVVYLVIMGLQTLIYEFLVYRRYLSINPFVLILKDTIFPLSMCLIIAFGSKRIIKSFTSSDMIQSAYAVFIGFIVLSILLIAFARDELKILFTKKRGGQQ